MSYPGNSSLAAEIQERILTTFEQTLDLASRGELQEAGIGCDFILRLDPLFQPAARLKERLAAGGEPLVDDLRLAEKPTAKAAAPGDVFDLVQEAAESDESEEEEEPDDDDFAAPPPGLISSPAAADRDSSVFADIQARELEQALDWSGLTDTPDAAAAGPDAQAAATPATDDVPTPPAAPEPVVPEPTQPAPTEPLGDNGPPPPEQPADAELMAAGEPIAALDSESEQRVDELLAEGQAAFESGGYQSAIDAWSRIFLIDIDHQEASRRIELARKLKAEVERQVEELYHEGVSKVEKGDFDAARESFTKVIEIQGSHLAAQEYLDKLDAGTIEARSQPAASEAPAAEGGESLAVPEDLAPQLDGADAPRDTLEIPDGLGELAEIPPPPPGERPERPRPDRPAPTAAKPRGVKRSFLVIGGAVLVLAAVAGWLLYRNFDDTFPNAGQPAQTAPRPRVDVIARAQQVHDEGNTELAIAQLKRLPPNHARYAEAQALIAQWETPAQEPAQQEQASAEQIAERDRLVAAARAAFDNREFLRSHRLLTQAAAVTALGDEGLQLQTAAALELQPLRSEIEIFRQGEWGQALRSLWQMRQEDPGNPDVEQLMVDSYYNLGVRALQRRDPQEAAENLREALALAGEDAELERVLRFAESYQNRSVDLLYRIFVKYLPFR